MARITMLVSLLAGVAAAGATNGLAQQSSSTTVEALLGEVRLLRQALERQASLQARAQLMAGRLALQDQRLARARSELQRSEAEARGLASERSRMQSALAELRGSMESGDPAEQAALEREQRMLAARLEDVEKAVAVAEARQSRAAQAVAAEESRYDEMERWFDDLDRELTRLGR